jgi:site-specific DNA-cytosine methylase
LTSVFANLPTYPGSLSRYVVGGISEQIQATLLNEMGYDVAVRTLNAADYGVPQLRERAFFIASRVGLASFPEPTHVDPHREELLALGSRPWVTVEEAIGDLPNPPTDLHDELGGGSLDLYPDTKLSEFAQDMRSTIAFPYNHITRQYNASVLRIIREMQPGETWDRASERMRHAYMTTITEHRRADESEEQTIKRLDAQDSITAAFFKRYYWSAYTRLAWDKPALTITANANFLGSGRFTHPAHQRGVTMREAARLQTFDDDFRFITSAIDENDTTTIGVGMDMIGEAVPPLLAEAIAHHIAFALDRYYAPNTQAIRTAVPMVSA